MAQERRGRSLLYSFVHYVIRAALRRWYRKGSSAWLYLSEKSKFVQNCRKLAKADGFFHEEKTAVREGTRAYTQVRYYNGVISDAYTRSRQVITIQMSVCLLR